MLDRNYDMAVKMNGPGVEGTAMLAAPEARSDEFDEEGKPTWDDTERAAPVDAVSNDGRLVAAESAAASQKHSTKDLAKMAAALSIPGRQNMKKSRLGIEVTGPSRKI